MVYPIDRDYTVIGLRESDTVIAQTSNLHIVDRHGRRLYATSRKYEMAIILHEDNTLTFVVAKQNNKNSGPVVTWDSASYRVSMTILSEGHGVPKLSIAKVGKETREYHENLSGVLQEIVDQLNQKERLSA